MADAKQVSATYTATSGGTVVIPAFDDNVMCCFVDSAGLLAVLTVQLPAGAKDGQAVRVFFGNTITLLTFTTLAGTIRGLLTSIAGGSSAVYAWSAVDNAWWKG